MTKKYALAVSNTVRFPVKVKLLDGDGKEKEFKFYLIMDRLGAQESIEVFKAKSAFDVLREYTKGWESQRLVLEDDGTPAEFCADAFESLLDIQGLTLVCFNAYVKAINAVEKT